MSYHDQKPHDPASGLRSIALADPTGRTGLPERADYVYQGTGTSLRPEDAAAYVRLRTIRRHAIATPDDAPLPDSLMAPAEVHRERTDEEHRALLATSRAARAAVPAPTVIRLEVERDTPALPAAAPAVVPAPERCGRCGYLTAKCQAFGACTPC